MPAADAAGMLVVCLPAITPTVSIDDIVMRPVATITVATYIIGRRRTAWPSVLQMLLFYSEPISSTPLNVSLRNLNT